MSIHSPIHSAVYPAIWDTTIGPHGGSPFTIDGNVAEAAWDFKLDYFRKAGVSVSFDDLFVYTTLGARLGYNSVGVLKWQAHNLFKLSNIPATQNVTVLADFTYTIAFKGTGTITISGGAGNSLVGTGVDDLVSIELTSTTTTLTCTITGSVSVVRVYHSDHGGMFDDPDPFDATDPTYVPTINNLPVFKRCMRYYYNGSVWDGPFLQVESADTTNLFLSSNVLTAGGWSNSSSVSLTAAAATGPDGLSSMFKLAGKDTTPRELNIYQLAADNATLHILSGHVREGTPGEHAVLKTYDATAGYKRTWFDLSDGTVATTEHEDAGVEILESGMYRIWVANTYEAVSGRADVAFSLADAEITSTPTGLDNEYIFISHVQLEERPEMSSYFPSGTNLAGVRATEVINILGADTPSNTDAMSIWVEGRLNYRDNNNLQEQKVYLWTADASNYIGAHIASDSTRVSALYLLQNSAGVLDFVIGTTGPYLPGTNVLFNVCTRHTSGALNGAIGGVALTEDTTPTTLCDLSAANFGPYHNWTGFGMRGAIWGVDLGNSGIVKAGV